MQHPDKMEVAIEVLVKQALLKVPILRGLVDNLSLTLSLLVFIVHPYRGVCGSRMYKNTTYVPVVSFFYFCLRAL